MYDHYLTNSKNSMDKGHNKYHIDDIDSTSIYSLKKIAASKINNYKGNKKRLSISDYLNLSSKQVAYTHKKALIKLQELSHKYKFNENLMKPQQFISTPLINKAIMRDTDKSRKSSYNIYLRSYLNALSLDNKNKKINALLNKDYYNLHLMKLSIYDNNVLVEGKEQNYDYLRYYSHLEYDTNHMIVSSPTEDTNDSFNEDNTSISNNTKPEDSYYDNLTTLNAKLRHTSSKDPRYYKKTTPYKISYELLNKTKLAPYVLTIALINNRKDIVKKIVGNDNYAYNYIGGDISSKRRLSEMFGIKKARKYDFNLGCLVINNFIKETDIILKTIGNNIININNIINNSNHSDLFYKDKNNLKYVNSMKFSRNFNNLKKLLEIVIYDKNKTVNNLCKILYDTFRIKINVKNIENENNYKEIRITENIVNNIINGKQVHIQLQNIRLIENIKILVKGLIERLEKIYIKIEDEREEMAKYNKKQMETHIDYKNKINKHNVISTAFKNFFNNLIANLPNYNLRIIKNIECQYFNFMKESDEHIIYKELIYNIEEVPNFYYLALLNEPTNKDLFIESSNLTNVQNINISSLKQTLFSLLKENTIIPPDYSQSFYNLNLGNLLTIKFYLLKPNEFKIYHKILTRTIFSCKQLYYFYLLKHLNHGINLLNYDRKSEFGINCLKMYLKNYNNSVNSRIKKLSTIEYFYNKANANIDGININTIIQDKDIDDIKVKYTIKIKSLIKNILVDYFNSCNKVNIKKIYTNLLKIEKSKNEDINTNISNATSSTTILSSTKLNVNELLNNINNIEKSTSNKKVNNINNTLDIFQEEDISKTDNINYNLLKNYCIENILDNITRDNKNVKLIKKHINKFIKNVRLIIHGKNHPDGGKKIESEFSNRDILDENLDSNDYDFLKQLLYNNSTDEILNTSPNTLNKKLSVEETFANLLLDDYTEESITDNEEKSDSESSYNNINKIIGENDLNDISISSSESSTTIEDINFNKSKSTKTIQLNKHYTTYKKNFNTILYSLVNYSNKHKKLINLTNLAKKSPVFLLDLLFINIHNLLTDNTYNIYHNMINKTFLNNFIGNLSTGLAITIPYSSFLLGYIYGTDSEYYKLFNEKYVNYDNQIFIANSSYKNRDKPFATYTNKLYFTDINMVNLLDGKVKLPIKQLTIHNKHYLNDMERNYESLHPVFIAAFNGNFSLLICNLYYYKFKILHDYITTDDILFTLTDYSLVNGNRYIYRFLRGMGVESNILNINNFLTSENIKMYISYDLNLSNNIENINKILQFYDHSNTENSEYNIDIRQNTSESILYINNNNIHILNYNDIQNFTIDSSSNIDEYYLLNLTNFINISNNKIMYNKVHFNNKSIEIKNSNIQFISDKFYRENPNTNKRQNYKNKMNISISNNIFKFPFEVKDFFLSDIFMISQALNLFISLYMEDIVFKKENIDSQIDKNETESRIQFINKLLNRKNTINNFTKEFLDNHSLTVPFCEKFYFTSNKKLSIRDTNHTKNSYDNLSNINTNNDSNLNSNSKLDIENKIQGNYFSYTKFLSTLSYIPPKKYQIFDNPIEYIFLSSLVNENLDEVFKKMCYRNLSKINHVGGKNKSYTAYKKDGNKNNIHDKKLKEAKTSSLTNKDNISLIDNFTYSVRSMWRDVGTSEVAMRQKYKKIMGIKEDYEVDT